MQVTLQVSNGPLAGRIIFLKAGQRAEIGRTEWADFTFPDDAEMADVHFTIECRADGCVVRDLNTVSGTIVGGAPITQTQLSHGAEILAGGTRFRVSLDSPNDPRLLSFEKPSSGTSSPAEGQSSDKTPAATYCEMLELSEDSESILKGNPNIAPDAFLAQLIERKLLIDALRFKAQLLPKKEAIAWAWKCVQTIDDKSPKLKDNQRALETVERWLAEPTEANRRDAGNAAQALNHETPAAWTAMAVFWSEGSLAPPEVEVIPPADHLTGVAASAALLLAAAAGPATEVSDKHRQFLQLSNQEAMPA